jgi:hypothetical protein
MRSRLSRDGPSARRRRPSAHSTVIGQPAHRRRPSAGSAIIGQPAWAMGLQRPSPGLQPHGGPQRVAGGHRRIQLSSGNRRIAGGHRRVQLSSDSRRGLWAFSGRLRAFSRMAASAGRRRPSARLPVHTQPAWAEGPSATALAGYSRDGPQRVAGGRRRIGLIGHSRRGLWAFGGRLSGLQRPSALHQTTIGASAQASDSRSSLKRGLRAAPASSASPQAWPSPASSPCPPSIRSGPCLPSRMRGSPTRLEPQRWRARAPELVEGLPLHPGRPMLESPASLGPLSLSKGFPSIGQDPDRQRPPARLPS